MKSTRERFRRYVELENMVMERIKELADLGGEIVRVTLGPDGATYDRVVILRKKVKLEIQITEGVAFESYGDIRLDLISAFTFDVASPHLGSRYIRPDLFDDFLHSITVHRPGKLYECEADTLAYYITDPVDLLWLFAVNELQANRAYFINKYGVMINAKVDESWESCFVPVSAEDEVLNKYGIRLTRERE